MSAPPTPVRAALRGWLLAASVYFLAVLHRSSLGVAGLDAEHRFHLTPAQLSVFIFVQLGVYAAMQVPTGVLVDRYGPRRLLVLASVVMGGAQLLFASIPSYPAALLARTLLGCGDALTFISVLRFAASRFSVRRYPLLVALTSMAGMAGNLVATLPLALLLHRLGWSTSFAVAGALSLCSAVAVWLFLPGAPAARRARHGAAEIRAGLHNVAGRVHAAWAQPGTRLGFWVHFSCMSTANAMALLWGDEYLIKAVGFSTAGAGAVLMYGVLAAGIASPAIGWLIGARVPVRVPLALAVNAFTIGGWLVLCLGFGDVPPQGYVVALFVFTALGAPTSMVAFALARDYNGARTLGTASGVVNVGGFTATIIVALGIGWALDALGDTSAHTLRLAVLVAVAVQVFGSAQVLHWLRRVRSAALRQQERGDPVPVAVVRRRWDIAGESQLAVPPPGGRREPGRASGTMTR